MPECCGSGSEGAWGEGSRWPLDAWCGALQAQLFSAQWEARHGAASALRELLRAPIVNSAGMHSYIAQEQVYTTVFTVLM